MITLRREPTRTDTLFPYSTRGRSPAPQPARAARRLRRRCAAPCRLCRAHMVLLALSRPGDGRPLGTRALASRARTDDQVGPAFPAAGGAADLVADGRAHRSEEHTSELQSLMRFSSAVLSLNKNVYYMETKHRRHARDNRTSDT